MTEIRIKEHLEKMTEFQTNLLNYLDQEENNEENLQNIRNIFDDNKIYDKSYELKLLFHLILKLSNNYYRKSDFFSKIEKILEYFKNHMKQYFSNSKLFSIFKSNKRILLYLFEEKIIIMDEFIAKQLSTVKRRNKNYPLYFAPELKPLMNEFIKPKNIFPFYLIVEIEKEQSEDFYVKRKIGENDEIICQIIRNDSLDEFIDYISKNDIQLDSIIQPSIFETNNFLLKNNYVSLIEYAAFFGSKKIFQYLIKFNNMSSLETSIWNYAIHGGNAEIIHYLEENHIQPALNDKKEYEIFFKESIKCHFNDAANYIKNKYIKEDWNKSFDILINALKYYNFYYIQNELINDSSFGYLCKYDYFMLVQILLCEKEININQKIANI